eukprot:1139547-Pelagomonas_calceolata.AAC.1
MQGMLNKLAGLNYRAISRTHTCTHTHTHTHCSKRQEALDALAAKGVPLDYEDLMRSMVYDPDDVPNRLSKVEVSSPRTNGRRSPAARGFGTCKNAPSEWGSPVCCNQA